MELQGPESEGKEHLLDRKAEQSLLSIPPGALSPLDRVEIAEVFLDLRPATYQVVDSFIKYDPVYAQTDYRKNVRSVEHVIKEIGLPFFMSSNEEETKFIIGNSLENAIKLRNIYAMEPLLERTRQFGLALGYPKTAVEAFIEMRKGNRQAVISPEVIADEIEEKEVLPFLAFRLSRDHWKEEVGILQNRLGVLKKRMPDLYQRVVEAKRRI